MKPPITTNEWLNIADGFEKRWSFPHCVGAIDGKHVQIVKPDHSGSMYFNYKKTCSIVLMAVCNAKYEFTLVDVGECGRQSDGGVFRNSNLGHAIVNELFDLPPQKSLPGTDLVQQYVFVADDAFPMGTNLVKPY